MPEDFPYRVTDSDGDELIVCPAEHGRDDHPDGSILFEINPADPEALNQFALLTPEQALHLGRALIRLAAS